MNPNVNFSLPTQYPFGQDMVHVTRKTTPIVFVCKEKKEAKFSAPRSTISIKRYLTKARNQLVIDSVTHWPRVGIMPDTVLWLPRPYVVIWIFGILGQGDLSGSARHYEGGSPSQSCFGRTLDLLCYSKFKMVRGDRARRGSKNRQIQIR